MRGIKVGFLTVAVVLAAFGAYMIANSGVRAESPDARSQSWVKAATGELTLPAGLGEQPPMPQALLKTEGFEGDWPDGWVLGGDPTWGPETCNKHSGSKSGWPARGGANGVPGCVNNYPSNMNATMTYGPFDLSAATAAGVNFWFDLTSEPNYDWFYAQASRDGVNWSYSNGFSGNGWGGWRNDYPFDLTPLLGDSSVWFRFKFTSDTYVTYRGVFVDDVEIWCTGCGAATPDLVETSVSNPPASANRGTSFSVTDTAKNQGGQQAGPSYTRYYLSLDTVRNTGDKLLTGKRSVPALAPGATSTGTKSVTIPGNTAPGTYYLLACADDTLLVTESDENNNCIASDGNMLVTAPDLKESALTKPPTSVKQGGSFNVTDTTANVGTGPAGASTTQYYLSLDKIKSLDDRLLDGSRAVEPLAAGASSTGTVGVTVPLATPLGTYYLLACADDLKVVKESKEGNNCRASASKVQVTAP